MLKEGALALKWLILPAILIYPEDTRFTVIAFTVMLFFSIYIEYFLLLEKIRLY